METPRSTAPADLAEHLLAELRARGNVENVAGMARYGISPVGTLGVTMPDVRALAREAKRTCGGDQTARHAVAAALWASGVHEARIMAGLVDHPALIDETQMESWALDLDSWDVCDTLCINLFRLAPLAWEKAAEWPGRREEFVKRAGFVLGATLAVHEKAADDERLLPFLVLAAREATDDRPLVKKAVNWSIRQIGKRSAALNVHAVETAEKILAENPDSRSARWIARDALRELRSDAVRRRLGLTEE
jgi:3-methyladenine DNA glycosylase AlkD